MRTTKNFFWSISFLLIVTSAIAQELSFQEDYAEFEGLGFWKKELGIEVFMEDDRYIYLMVNKSFDDNTLHIIKKDRTKLSRTIEEPFKKVRKDEQIETFGKLGDVNYLAYTKILDSDHHQLLFKEVKKNWLQGGRGKLLDQHKVEDARFMSWYVINDPQARYLGIISLLGDETGRYKEEIKVLNADLEVVTHKIYETSDKFNLQLHALQRRVGLAPVLNLESAIFDEGGNIIVKNANQIVLFRADQNYDRWIYNLATREIGGNYFVNYMDFHIQNKKLYMTASVLKDTTGNREDRDMTRFDQYLEEEIGTISQVISLENFDAEEPEIHEFSEEESLNLPERISYSESRLGRGRNYVDNYFKEVESLALEDGSYLRVSEYHSRITGFWFSSDILVQKFDSEGNFLWNKIIDKGEQIDLQMLGRSYAGGLSLGKVRNSYQTFLQNDKLYFIISRSTAVMDKDDRKSGFRLLELDLKNGDIEENIQAGPLVDQYYFIPNRRPLAHAKDNYILAATEGLKEIRFGFFTIEESETGDSEDSED